MSAVRGSTTLVDDSKQLPPRPLAYLIVWGTRGERRDVRLSKREAEDVARVMHGQVVPLGEVRPHVLR